MPDYDISTMEVGLESSVEIKRSKRLKGQPILQGDGLAGFQALLLSCLAEGPSRLENLPATPWFQDILEDFIRMGYAQQALDGQWLIHGGSAPVSGPEPIRIRHEAELLPMAAFLAAQNCQRTLEVNADCVSGEALEILGKILLMEKPPTLESHPETAIEPALATETENENQTFLIEAPTGLTPRATALLRNSNSQTGASTKPADLGWDEYLAKLTLLTYHISVGQPLDLSLTKSGPDLIDGLAAHFELPIKIDRNEAPEGDELARRIARQMRAAGKTEPVLRLRLAAGKPKPQTYSIPADLTQASAFCLAATLIKGSDITLENIPLNPSRAGFISALRRMGADIEVVSRRERHGEGFGLLRIRTADLIGKRFGGDSISTLRDEIFLLMVAAAFAEGETVIRDIAHLRRHRRDLLKIFVANLRSAGVEIGEIEDGLVIRGRADYDGSAYDALGHPGLGLACLVMGLKSHGTSLLWGAGCLAGKYPGMVEQMATLGQVTAGEKP